MLYTATIHGYTGPYRVIYDYYRAIYSYIYTAIYTVTLHGYTGLYITIHGYIYMTIQGYIYNYTGLYMAMHGYTIKPYMYTISIYTIKIRLKAKTISSYWLSLHLLCFHCRRNIPINEYNSQPAYCYDQSYTDKI